MVVHDVRFPMEVFVCWPQRQLGEWHPLSGTDYPYPDPVTYYMVMTRFADRWEVPGSVPVWVVAPDGLAVPIHSEISRGPFIQFGMLMPVIGPVP